MKKYITYITESLGVSNIVKSIIKNIKIETGNQIIDLNPYLPLILNLNIKHNFSYSGSCNGNINYKEIINSKFENITINIILDDIKFDKEKIREDLYHELTHLYELYKINRIINNDWHKLSNIIEFKIEKTNIGVFKYFLDIIYISFDHEIRARIASLYDYLITHDNTITSLKQSYAYKKYLELKDFDYYQIINFYKNNNFLNILIEFVNLLNIKFGKKTSINNETDLIKYFQKWKFHFNDSAKKYYRKMLKITSEVKKDLDENIIENIIENMCINKKSITFPVFTKDDINFIMENIKIIVNLKS